MGIPLYIICCFSFAAFNIFSLYLIFDSLINVCLGVFLLGLILYGTLCAYWTWLTILSHIWEVFTYSLFKYFLSSFLLLFFSGAPIIQMFVSLMLSQRSLSLSSIPFILFSLFCPVVVVSTILSSRSLIRSSPSVTDSF